MELTHNTSLIIVPVIRSVTATSCPVPDVCVCACACACVRCHAALFTFTAARTWQDLSLHKARARWLRLRLAVTQLKVASCYVSSRG